MTLRLSTSREEILAWLNTSLGEIFVDGLTCLLRDFEANGFTRFVLPNGCSIEGIAMWRHVSDFQPNNITSSKFSIYGQVKQR